MIAEFLTHLRRDKLLSVSAVKGYRSALNSVFLVRGMDLAASHALSLLLRSFEASCPPRAVRPPEWDLSLVLRSLTLAPYEPLGQASQVYLTRKFVFLLALASAKRVSELHGLSSRVRHTEGWSSVSFSFVPEFVAKNQNPSVADPRFEGFTIPALPGEGADSEDRLLCPVRACKRYLEMRQELRSDSRHLFISATGARGTVSKNTVSGWLRQVITWAYRSSGRGDAIPRVRAHEVRGVGSSLLFGKNMAVEQVLRAGTWKRQSTFTRFYLRDVTHRSLDTFSLGPVVAAQQVV